MKKYNNKILRIISGIIVLITPPMAFAATLTTNPFSQFVGNSSGNSLSNVVIGFYNFALMAAGGLAMGAIVYGAILYTISSGNSSKQSDAKSWITNALLGLAILLGAFLIFQIINPNIANLQSLQIPNLTQQNNARDYADWCFKRFQSEQSSYGCENTSAGGQVWGMVLAGATAGTVVGGFFGTAGGAILGLGGGLVDLILKAKTCNQYIDELNKCLDAQAQLAPQTQQYNPNSGSGAPANPPSSQTPPQGGSVSGGVIPGLGF